MSAQSDAADSFAFNRSPVPVQMEHLRGRIRGVEQAQQSHEEVCAARYGDIRADIATLNRRISWAAGVVVTVLISVLGWSLDSQWEQAQQTQRALIAVAQGARSAPGGQTVTVLPYLPAPQPHN